MWRMDSHLRGRLLGIQVSLSPTLGRIEKVEQHIRKKTCKLNALRFWVEGGVILLYGFGSVLILVRSPRFSPSDSPNSKWVYNIKHKCETI